jgi:hypothetical protein
VASLTVRSRVPRQVAAAVAERTVFLWAKVRYSGKFGEFVVRSFKCEKPGARNHLWLVPGYGGMFLCKKSKEVQSLFLVMSIVEVHAQDACRCRNIVDPEVMSGPRCEKGW